MGKRVFFFTLGNQGAQESNQLEKAIECFKSGDTVLYVNCDGTLGSCIQNPLFNQSYCKVCVQLQKANNKRYLPKSIEQHFLSYYNTKEILYIADKVKYEYSNLSELKSVTYKGLEIGFGAASSYVSLTKNINPRFDTNLIKYIDALLRLEVILAEIGEIIISNFNPQLVIFYNGRLASYKPILNLAQRHQLNYICTENIALHNDVIANNFYINSTPHSISANTERYSELWDKDKDIISLRETIARSFYERRRNSIKTDDKVYTKGQKLGILPTNWNKKMENICIFNTSEDEFCAISKEFDESTVFLSQLDGIKEIVEHYSEYDNLHFYLRIHPNLFGVKYKYHTDLLKLNYKNLTIISAESSVSTYTLIDACNKIIVFASTTGIESVYWGKPVICLSGTFYSELDVAYLPKTKDELWKLINTIDLQCKYNENVLKYGYFYMSETHKINKYVINEHVKYNIAGKDISILKYQKYFGSNIIFFFIMYFLKKITKKLGFTSKFKILPMEEM